MKGRRLLKGQSVKGIRGRKMAPWTASRVEKEEIVISGAQQKMEVSPGTTAKRLHDRQSVLTQKIPGSREAGKEGQEGMRPPTRSPLMKTSGETAKRDVQRRERARRTARAARGHEP